MATLNTQSHHRIISKLDNLIRPIKLRTQIQDVSKWSARDFTHNHRATSNTQIKLQVDVTCALTKPNGQRLRCPHNSPCSRWLAHVGELTCAVWTTSQLSEIAQTSVSLFFDNKNFNFGANSSQLFETAQVFQTFSLFAEKILTWRDMNTYIIFERKLLNTTGVQYHQQQNNYLSF